MIDVPVVIYFRHLGRKIYINYILIMFSAGSVTERNCNLWELSSRTGALG